MDFSQSNVLSNNSTGFGLQTNLINKKGAGSNSGAKMSIGGFYAKKGEPMYMKEMDSDEDGVISFDEFKEYCSENGISPKEMMKMMQLAGSYRTRQSHQKAEKEIKENSVDEKTETKEAESDAVYAKRGDANYDEMMDLNSDDKITFKEYMEYCKEKAKTTNQKSDTKMVETEDGEFKTTSTGKAINSYAQCESSSAVGRVDEEVY